MKVKTKMRKKQKEKKKWMVEKMGDEGKRRK